MTIEQILALLTAKFSGVRKDGLAQIARNLSMLATTEEEVQALIDKMDVEKVTEAIKDYRSNVDKEVSDATKKHETNLKKKFDFKEKQTEPGNPDPADPSDVASIVKAAVADAVKPFQEKLSGFEGQQITSTRLQTLEGKLENLPENYKAKVLKDFKRMSFESNESFEEYLTETEADITAFNQEMADKGLGQQSGPLFGKANAEGVSTGVQAYVDSKIKPESELGGKEV